jgi:hypothetical protein
MLEAATSSRLIPYENWISAWKEYNLQIIVFKLEKGSFSSKWGYSAELKKLMYLSKGNHLC